jgi:hypothetical protein
VLPLTATETPKPPPSDGLGLVKVVGVGLLVVADATGNSIKRLSATTPNASDAVLLCICDFFDLIGSLRFILGIDLISDNFASGSQS